MFYKNVSCSTCFIFIHFTLLFISVGLYNVRYFVLHLSDSVARNCAEVFLIVMPWKTKEDLKRGCT